MLEEEEGGVQAKRVLEKGRLTEVYGEAVMEGKTYLLVLNTR